MSETWRSAEPRRRLVLTCCLIAFLPVALPALADPYRVATFNCEFLIRSEVHRKFGFESLSGPAAATWSNPAYRSARFTEAADAVARVIAPLNADLIILTEIGDLADLTALRDAIAAHGLNYPHMSLGSTDGATGQFVAALSRTPFLTEQTNIPGRESYIPESDDPQDEDDTGVSKGLYFTVATQGHTLHVFAAHLIAERGGPEADAQRIAQASIIRRNYLPLVKSGQHVIVAGDFNDHPGQPALLRMQGFDDIDEDLIQTGATRYFDPADLDDRWTYMFEGNRQQIDHILISRSLRDACKIGRNGVQTFVIPMTTTITSSEPALSNLHEASDHRPMVVELDFR